MIKKTLALFVVGISVVGLLKTAEAASASGTITFSGSAVLLDAKSAGNASAVTAWSGLSGLSMPFVTSVSGSFASVAPGSALYFSTPNWNFSSGAMSNFWSVAGFTFDLSSSSIARQGSGFATVTGVGTLSGNGFDPTFGTWTFSVTDSSTGTPPVFSFTAAPQAPIVVPDGGATVCLLGLGLAGIEAFRRKLRKR